MIHVMHVTDKKTVNGKQTVTSNLMNCPSPLARSTAPLQRRCKYLSTTQNKYCNNHLQ